MEGGAFGKILEIDPKTIADISKLNESIISVGSSAESAAAKFNTSFASMTTSANALKESLEAINRALTGFDASKLQAGVQNIGAMQSSSISAAAAISDVATSLGKVNAESNKASNPFAKYNLEELLTRLPSLWAQLDKAREELKLLNQAYDTGKTDMQKFALEGLGGVEQKANDLMTKIAKLTELIKGVGSQRVNWKEEDAYYASLDKLERKQKSASVAEKERYEYFDKVYKEKQKAWQEENRQVEKSIENQRKEREAIEQKRRATQQMYEALWKAYDAKLQAQKNKDDKATEKAALAEQRAYSALETQLTRIQKLKADAEAKGYNTSKAADTQQKHYQQILDKETAINAEMEKMKANGSKLISDETKLLSAKSRVLSVQERTSRMQDQQYLESKKGALWSANEAKTYNERAAAIKNLEAAMKNLNVSSATYKQDMQELSTKYRQLNAQQEQFKKSMTGVKAAAEKITGTAKQMANALAAAFSVRAITGYVKKLIEVRGEFELQNVALRAILQNKDEADQLYAKVMKLAVESPFTVRQLTTYTKQLAAYKVESDKLYDTTKRLADVSAGLGVDMGRIILAYGQVKAANYLRATEVRQFTEAGINMLGELAKYYSDLENKMVSVAEVQERVTKRMVEFGDVEEVFNRLTSAGGIFYNMQEKQAKTLKGMMSNLQDSLDIMLNQIGIEQEDKIKGMITVVKSFMDNWKEVLWYIKKVGLALAGYILTVNSIKVATALFGNSNIFLAKAITGLDKALASDVALMKISEAETWGLSKAQVAVAKTSRTLTLAIKGLGVMLGGLAIGAVILTLTELIRKAGQARRELEAMHKEQDRMLKEDTASLQQQIAGYKELVDRLKDASEGSQERKEILDKINYAYKDYLPFIVDEKTSYDKLASSINLVNDALLKKAQLSSMEKMFTNLTNKTAESLSDIEKEFKQFEISLTSDTGVELDVIDLSKETRKVSQFFGLLQKNVEDLGRELTKGEINEILNSLFNPDGEVLTPDASIYFKASDYARQILKRKEEELAIQDKINIAYNNEFRTLEQVNKALAAQKQKEEEIAAARNKYSGYELSKAIDEANNKYEKTMLDLRKEAGLIDEDAYKKSLANIGKWATQTTQSINDNFREAAEGAGYSMDEISKVWITQKKQLKGMTSIEKDIKNTYTQQLADIKRMNTYKQKGIAFDEQDLEKTERQKRLLEIMADTIGLDLESKAEKNADKKAAKTAQDIAKERIALIQKVRKEYEENLKYMGEEQAKAFTFDSFKDNDVFKDLQNMGIIEASMNLDASGVISALEKLASSITGDAKKEVQTLIAQLQNEDVIVTIKANLEAAKLDIDKLFDRYELSKKMKELGLDESLSKQIFGEDTINLEGLKEEVERIKEEYKAANKDIGTEDEKYFTSVEKKITDYRQKVLEGRLKTYSTYLKKEFSEAVKIKLEEAKQLGEIESLVASGAFTEAQGETAKQGVKKDTQKKLEEYDWKQFQQSELYLELFENLENVSSTVLEQMKIKLNEVGDSLKNLSPEQLKQVREKITQIEEQLMDRSSMKVLNEKLKVVRELKKSGKTEKNLGIDLINETSALEVLNKQKEAIDTILASREGSLKITSEQLEKDENLQKFNELSTDELHKQSRELSRQVATKQEDIKATKANLDAYKDGRTAAQKLSDSWNTILSTVKQLKSSVDKVWDAMGKDEDDEAVENFINMGIELLEMVATAALFKAAIDSCIVSSTVLSVTLKTAIPIIGWILLAVEAIATVLATIIGSDKAAFESKIDTIQKRVDNLEKSFESLSEKIDDCYNINNLKEWNAEAEKTLALTIASEKEMVNMYRDRKNGSSKYEDEIQDLEDSIEEHQKTLRELREQYTESLGGFGSAANLKSAAEEFIDAWKEAFDETGDGLSGLEDQLSEFMQNAVKKQALLRVSERFIEPLLEQIDAFADKSKEMTDTEYINGLTALMEKLKTELPALSQSLEPFFSAISGIESDSLSGLASGIQGVTEDTAEVLASIVESIRFYSASNFTILQNIELNLTTPSDENPWYYQLKRQADAIVDLRDSIKKMTASVGLKTALQVQIV